MAGQTIQQQSQAELNPHGKYFTIKQMKENFNLPGALLRDSTYMEGHEAWCKKIGQGKTCPWLFNYDAFMEHYDDIVSRRHLKLD